jgi:hypothetical protein
MSVTTNLDNLQYMREIGVDESDVAWYAQFAASASKRSQSEVARARRIADQAFMGLCSTIVSHPVQKAV